MRGKTRIPAADRKIRTFFFSVHFATCLRATRVSEPPANQRDIQADIPVKNPPRILDPGRFLPF